jgi:transposase
MAKTKIAKIRKEQPQTTEEFLGEIRKLLILYLYKNKISTSEIAEMLGYSYKVIETMLPKQVKKKGVSNKK